MIGPGKKIPPPAGVSVAPPGMLEGVHRAEVLATGERVRVIRVHKYEAVCNHMNNQTRLYNVRDITPPRPACPVCFKYLDPDGACPDARRHERDALYAAGVDATRFNRKARRALARRAKGLGRLLTS